MKSEDFSLWLLAISGMSAAQRAEGLAALEKAAADAGPSTKTRGKRTEDALGTTGVERVERQGCPHCAGREIVGWGRSDGLLRFRCKSCGRTFNGLTKTPMAHLRKKEKWLDHAQAMIEGKSLAKTAQLCGVHPTTAFRWRHRFLRAPSDDKPRCLSGIVEADKPSSSNPSRAVGPICRVRRENGAGPPGIRGPIRTIFPSWSPATGRARRWTPFCRRPTATSIAAVLTGIVTSVNHLVGDGGKPLAAFARKAEIPFHAVPGPGKPKPAAPHLHINNVNAYHSRLKQWLARFNGVATKNLPNYLGWRRALEAWDQQINPQKWIMSAIGIGPYQQITP